MPAIKIIDILFLKPISAVDQRNVRFKSEKRRTRLNFL